MHTREVKTVDRTSICGAKVRDNGAMFEALVIALLVWLWVIERRLNHLRESVHSLQLDVDGLRAMRSQAATKAANPPPELPGLPEVSSINGGDKKAAAS